MEWTIKRDAAKHAKNLTLVGVDCRLFEIMSDSVMLAVCFTV